MSTWLPRPLSFGCGLTARGSRLDGHVHDHDEICLVADQATEIRHGGVWRRAAPGDIFLFRRGELHGYRNARDEEPHLWLVHYQGDPDLDRACLRLADPDPERRSWHLSPAQQAGYQALFTRLMAEGLYPQRAGHEAALAAWLRLILVTASRWGEDVPQDPPAVAADPELANLWEILAEHVEAPEADLAAALARRVPNYDSLRHRFKRVYGRAPRDLVACMRLERAKHLLLETDLQIGEVAERLGYGRPAEFTRAFTRAVGSSPGAFRRQPGS